MKRIFLFVLTFALLLSCAACAPETEPAQDSAQDAAQTDQTDETPEDDAAGEASPESEEPEEEPAQPEETDPETETDDASDSPAREPLEAGSLAGQLGLESGLLSTEEVAAVEQLLGAGEEEILAALSLTEADVDTESSDESRLTLAARRDLLGTECYQTFNLSLSEPEGFYSLEFQGLLEGDADTLTEAVGTLYDDVCSLYGEPDTYEGSPRVSAWLEDPSSTDSSNLTETWPLTDRLYFGISVNHMENAALIRLEYRLVVDTSSYPFTVG